MRTFCATMFSLEVGFGVDDMVEKGGVWALTSDATEEPAAGRVGSCSYIMLNCNVQVLWHSPCSCSMLASWLMRIYVNLPNLSQSRAN